MRDLIIVSVFCIAAAIAVDHFRFHDKYFGEMEQSIGQSVHRLQQAASAGHF